MPSSGTRKVSVNVGEPKTSIAHPLDTVLTIAAQHNVEPTCLSFGPLQGSGSKPVFAAFVAALDASGQLLATWTSEPMFGTSEAALEHAGDLIDPRSNYEELF